MSNGPADNEHASSPDEQSGTDTPQAEEDQTPKTSAVHILKRAFGTTKRFIARQKIPLFLKFYGDHWQDILQHVRDGFSQPSDSELWIRGSDPSPGVFREEHAWDIEASNHCAICGRRTDEPRRRVRSVVRDFDGLVYGLAATVLVMIVMRFATGSSIIAVGTVFAGLWIARRLIVEEKVRLDCSTCADHAGREETLPLRLKRDTLIIELGGRKARLAFLRKLRDASTPGGWENLPPEMTDDESPVAPLALTVPGGHEASSDADLDDSSMPVADTPFVPSRTDTPAADVPPRIALADSDDASPVEFRSFSLHESDGASIDAPIASSSQHDSEPPPHFFQPESADQNGEIPPQAPAGGNRDGYTGSVLIPESDGEAETFFVPSQQEPTSIPDGWYVRIDGVEIGPVPLEQVRKLKSSGTLKPTDLVRQEHESDWSGPNSVPAADGDPAPKLPPAPPASDSKQTPGDSPDDPWTEPKDEPDPPWDPWAE